MKIAKIILGLFLLYGTASEYLPASRQLGSFFNPGIIIGTLVMIGICTWLIGSGMSQQRLRLKSLSFLRYLGISVGLLIFFGFMSVGRLLPSRETIEVNGLRVNIGKCMKGNEVTMPDENQRRQFCICTLTKLTADRELVEQYKYELQSGNYAELLKEILKGPNLEKYALNECYYGVTNIKWTPAFEKSARSNIMKNLNEAQIASTNNIDKYCDCLIEEYKKLPVSQLSSPGFADSEKGLLIDSLCNAESRIK